MDAPTAKILSVDSRSALLRVDGVVACARCAAGKGCGAGLLTGDKGPLELSVALPPDSHYRQGDHVTLTLQPARLLQATLYAYGLPLLGLTLAPLLANWLFGPLGDATLAVIALAAIAATVLLGRQLLARDRCLQDLVPSIAGRATVDKV